MPQSEFQIVLFLSDGSNPTLKKIQKVYSDGRIDLPEHELGSGYKSLRAFCIALLIAKKQLKGNLASGIPIQVPSMFTCDWVSVLVNACEGPVSPCWLEVVMDFCGGHEIFTGIRGRSKERPDRISYNANILPVERLQFYKDGSSLPLSDEECLLFAKELDLKATWRSSTTSSSEIGPPPNIEKSNSPQSLTVTLEAASRDEAVAIHGDLLAHFGSLGLIVKSFNFDQNE